MGKILPTEVKYITLSKGTVIETAGMHYSSGAYVNIYSQGVMVGRYLAQDFAKRPSATAYKLLYLLKDLEDGSEQEGIVCIPLSTTYNLIGSGNYLTITALPIEEYIQEEQELERIQDISLDDLCLTQEILEVLYYVNEEWEAEPESVLGSILNVIHIITNNLPLYNPNPSRNCVNKTTLFLESVDISVTNLKIEFHKLIQDPANVLLVNRILSNKAKQLPFPWSKDNIKNLQNIIKLLKSIS